ncbi:MAG: hypothetical protein LBR20_00870, partial [Propionibacteriaceae bacterium]|nr:hypothetical protein [Propionibacteriaceae bacterium]
EGKAELDFTVQLGETIAGVEVKAGTHIRSKSLGVFTTKYPGSQAIRISQKNFGLENSIRSVPLYAAFCLT